MRIIFYPIVNFSYIFEECQNSINLTKGLKYESQTKENLIVGNVINTLLIPNTLSINFTKD